jgi:hypothetical protein
VDFETLDKIADSYIPALAAVFFFTLAFRAMRKPGERRGLLRVFLFFAGMLGVSYGIKFLDRVWHLWASVGLDYSTHTAVALTVVMSLCAVARKFWIMIVASLVLYALLMVYQKYHTPADIVSTVIPLALVALLLGKLFCFPRPDRKSADSQS